MAKKLIQGNHAILEAAVVAGMGFYAGYPITPASEVMERAASVAAETEAFAYIAFEDEIASINAIVGASIAGAKAMTATSGPGFSLMQEGIGLGHMTRSPIVIVNVQRVGPSTGMPTLAAQADIMQSRWGSHGDYYPIAFSPNSVEESYTMTIQSFNAAEEALIPVILLTDGYIGHLYESVDFSSLKIPVVKNERPAFGSGRRHFTGLLSKDGIPCTKNSEYYREWLQNYKGTIQKVADRYNFHESIPNPKSDTLIISYGIISRVVRDLGDKYAYFRPIRLWPVLELSLIHISEPTRPY